MAQLPADRTKLALAQGNQSPTLVAASAKNINAITELYDTTDLLNAKVDTHTAAPVLPHADGSVSTSKIANEAVTTPKIAPFAVETGKIAESAVMTSKLAPSAVTQDKMADNSVGTSELIPLSVTTEKIANGSVTADKIDPALFVPDVTLNAHKNFAVLDHPDGSVTRAKLSADVQAELNRIIPNEREIANLKAASSIANRVDKASYTFYDINDGLNGGSIGTIDLSKTNATSAISATGSPIIVPVTGGTTGFAVGQEVTIFDDVNLERNNITGVATGASLSFSHMNNSYKANAMICRSSVVQDTVNKLLKFGGWSHTGFITNTAVNVVAAAYDTSGNNGDKLVNTANGNLITIEVNGTTIQVQKSIDNGVSFQPLCTITGAQVGAAIAWNGGNSVTILWNTTTIVYSNTFDVTTVTNTDQNANKVIVDNACTSIVNGMSIKTGTDGKPTASWSGIHPTYPNSKNIRSAKASTTAVTTWTKQNGTAGIDQLFTVNTAGQNYENPCVVIKSNNNPVIVFTFTFSTYNVQSLTFNGSTWNGAITVYAVATYAQSNPCARVAPNGRIWCMWYGMDATDTTVNNIHYSYSDDSGATWSAMVKLTIGNVYHQQLPTISIDKYNNVYVLWRGLDAASAGYYNIFRNIWTGSAFQGATKLTTNTTGNAQNPASIDNNTMDFNLLTPPMIYQDSQAVAVKFSGTYFSEIITPVPVEDVRYNDNPASNVSSMVVWVDHDADANFSIEGACSFQASGGVESYSTMTKTTVAIDATHDEDLFEGSGISGAKATLRLTLTRNSTALVKNIQDIMGAVGA